MTPPGVPSTDERNIVALGQDHLDFGATMRDFTDSFCERCGTRYTFSPAPTKGPSLAGAKVLAMGLKNFVLSDETSMDEALSAARHDAERGESARVAEEFHRTFNFCMTCRQYACDKCWNPNQGACLSCAPLWDFEPIAPEEHLIIRTPVARGTLDGMFSSSPTAAAAALRNAANDLAWPVEDPLPAHPDPNRNGKGKRAAEPVAAEPVAAEPVAAEPVAAEPVAAEPVAAATEQPTPAPRPLVVPPTRPEPRPEPARQRPPVRPAAEHAARIAPLPEQSESWKSRDDGWTLWPSGPGDGSDLTAEELMLVQAQLQHPAPSELPVPPAGMSDVAFVPSHTLAEDAAQVAPRDVDRGVAPQAPVRGTWEPESPAPRTAPSSDFDLLGSLRGPIEFPQAAARSESDHAPVLGRLLRHRGPASEPARSQAPDAAPAAAAPKSARPSRAPKPRSGQAASPWPTATPWATRPVERRDWQAEERDEVRADESAADEVFEQALEYVEATPADAAPAYMAPRLTEPTFAAPATVERTLRPAAEASHEPEIEAAFTAAFMATAVPRHPKTTAAADSSGEPATIPPPVQKPMFTMPPATDNRWPEPVVELVARPAVEWPTTDPVDQTWTSPAAPAKRKLADNAPANWPPLGASWPAQNPPAAPWPTPDGASVPAALVAAQHTDLPEAAMVTALWAESAQQVLNRGSVRVCHRCALPVSTHARFCRRCGTQQS